MGNGKIDHGLEAGFGVDDVRDHVDAHCDRTEAALNFGHIGNVDSGSALDNDVIAGMGAFHFGLYLLGMDEVDPHLAVNVSLSGHIDAGNVTCGGKTVGSLAVDLGDDGSHLLLKLIYLPAESFGDHARALLKADMTGKSAVLNALVEFIDGDADALLLHNGGAEGGEGVYALAHNGLNVDHAAGKADGKQIHHEAGVDAGAENGYAVLLGDTVELSRKLGMLCLGISHFLGGGNYVDAVLKDELELGEYGGNEGIGRNNGNVRSALIDDGVYIVGDEDFLAVAPFDAETLEYAHTVELIPHVAYAGDLDALLVKEHPCDTGTHCTKAPNGYSNIFHNNLRVKNMHV